MNGHHSHFSQKKPKPSHSVNSGYMSISALQSDFMTRERLEIRSAMLGIQQRLTEIEDDLARLVPIGKR